MNAILQRAARDVVHGLREALYPMTCVLCEARVETEHALCPDCWTETPFISGAACGLCGTSLPGTSDEPEDRCDECLTLARPWDEGRAVLQYSGTARRMVLALKHGDRTELGAAGGLWLARRARDLLTPGTLVIPVPVHPWRLLRRRYNQAALLAQAAAREAGAIYEPQALVRHRRTLSQDHRNVRDRFENLADAISPGAPPVAGHHVALVDDVMTSGATMAACADALRQAGARRITTLVLARVAKDP